MTMRRHIGGRRSSACADGFPPRRRPFSTGVPCSALARARSLCSPRRRWLPPVRGHRPGLGGAARPVRARPVHPGPGAALFHAHRPDRARRRRPDGPEPDPGAPPGGQGPAVGGPERGVDGAAQRRRPGRPGESSCSPAAATSRPWKRASANAARNDLVISRAIATSTPATSPFVHMTAKRASLGTLAEKDRYVRSGSKEAQDLDAKHSPCGGRQAAGRAGPRLRRRPRHERIGCVGARGRQARDEARHGRRHRGVLQILVGQRGRLRPAGLPDGTDRAGPDLPQRPGQVDRRRAGCTAGLREGGGRGEGQGRRGGPVGVELTPPTSPPRRRRRGCRTSGWRRARRRCGPRCTPSP